MINEDMVQVLNDVKSDVFRDFRVASPCFVINVHNNLVDVQLTVKDCVDGVYVTPPVIKNLYVVGINDMPNVGTVGVVLHLDRANQVPGSVLVNSGGPAHEINYGVFLPLVGGQQ